MKTNQLLFSITAAILATLSASAQETNMVLNNSFENTSEMVNSTGEILLADSVSSSNNTTVDLYSKNAGGNFCSTPDNYMGSSESRTGNNYAGFIAYYADDAGVFKTKPGYRKYSEYIQMMFSTPLTAGQAYTITYNVSLAEASAYAVSGLGTYFSTTKMDVKSNAFLKVVPHTICTKILGSTEWTTVTSTYVANGGERYITLGCFDRFMEAKKIIAPNTNNSRKAYYFIDDVGVSPKIEAPENLTAILYGACYRLDHLNFETDKSVILEGSYEELEALCDFLKSYPTITVYIDGYTDVTGTEEHNKQLSGERAVVIKDYLQKEGIEGKRMKARGYGENLTIDKKNDNSFVNRRVEITLCGVPEPVGETRK